MIAIPESGSELPAPEPSSATLSLLAQRRSCVASQLTGPAPGEGELHDLLCLAARVPDHGKLSPWRFIVLRGGSKQAFVECLREIKAKDADAGPKDATAIEKLDMPPLSVVVISRVSDCRIPVWEQELSAGAVCMNLLTAACAMGLGANWITGWYAYDERVNALLGLGDGERIAGYIQIGQINAPLKERPRCKVDELYSEWQP